MTEQALSKEEIAALRHRLAMYQQLVSMYPMEHKYLQKQAEVLILLGEVDEAELILLQLHNKLSNLGLVDEANKSANVRQYINKEKLCKQLYSTPFLHLASSNFLEKAFRSHRRLELADGDYLIRYGAHETQMFILVKGELTVWSRDPNGKRCYEHTMQVGEVIGELAFLDNTPRSADVIASDKATVLAIPSKAALRLFMETPEVEQTLRRSATIRKIQMDIKKSPELAKLPNDIQALLARHGSYKHFSAIERIYQYEQKIKTIDLISNGYVRLVGELKDGSSMMLNSLKTGALLGCSAATHHMNGNYIADIVSMGDTTLIQFPLDFFCKAMNASPKLHQTVLTQAELEHGNLLQTFSNQTVNCEPKEVPNKSA